MDIDILRITYHELSIIFSIYVPGEKSSRVPNRRYKNRLQIDIIIDIIINAKIANGWVQEADLAEQQRHIDL